MDMCLLACRFEVMLQYCCGMYIKRRLSWNWKLQWARKRFQEKDVLLFARRRTFTSLTCERRGGLAGSWDLPNN
eukprot:scaffold3831_cov246-Chaetoceros_neogracile.AAC.3